MSYVLSYTNGSNYLIKRGRFFYISIRCEGKIFRKSLKTDILPVAQEMVENVLIETRRIGKMSVELLKAIVDDQIDTAIEAATAVLYPRSLQGKAAIKAHYKQTIGATLHNMQVEDAEGMASEDLSQHYKHVPTFRESQVDKLRRPSNLPQADENDCGLEEHYEQPTQELGLLDTYKKSIANALANDDLVTAHNNLAALKQSFEIGTASQTELVDSPTTPTFKEALDQYIHDKSSNLYIKKNKPVSKKASDEKINYLSGLILNLWKDKPIGDINGKEIDRAFRLYSQFPLTKHNPWKSMTLEERIEAAEQGDVPEGERVGKTLGRIKTAVNLFFDHFWRLAVIDNNPVKDMRFNDFVGGGERGSFTKAQLNDFQTFATTNDLDGFKVAILLQMYSGMRNSEISNIQPEDIKTEQGVDYIHVRGTKTVNAERYIPIHSKLKEFGVVDYIKAGGEIYTSQSITQRFNRLMQSLSMSKEDSKGLPLSFYSFRHNFASGLASGGVSELHIEWLMGHSHTGTKQRYIDRGVEHVPSLAESINCLSYEFM
ncbi:tyrosine-type recombinase/integrase [Vibrio parahaemolyticus]|uniref:tyrosine-type recombinase/integrase n=2 Tax=Vibrio parahaemolyticus TaxID=670 RepID=UPI0009B0DAA0|nr:tyrosine-type recombinase/integrase [Vibrio parahaemolyticus]MDF4313743.1 tyrosine-type recombinase/integrase [Vibrio parahaemolyticus]MDF4597471.1 tyrosine-type recombinase/integrase [Vibrio parahaemolyticus]HCG5516586.1 tyrosine-type recombinase/integrase [Vibrio parahaemolyticus]HCG7551282.1 tyrosine-type recombinase/integrase [Vibrio parahaemolyticus]HCH6462602.1 tyrosine-type recombinase/integrase [Vibrio parahaemolyticus]